MLYSSIHNVVFDNEWSVLWKGSILMGNAALINIIVSAQLVLKCCVST